jgi:hypothetical protein
VAIVADFRVPVRSSDSLLGEGDFGGKLTFVGEAPSRGGFTPYLNVGALVWDGDTSNSLNLGAGFSQLFADKLSFSFDLIGAFDLESDTFLEMVDDEVPSGAGPQAAAFFSLLDHGLHANVVPTIGLAFHY